MSKTIYLIAGESSGDALGARLMKSIRRLAGSMALQTPPTGGAANSLAEIQRPERAVDIIFAGVGGPAMIGAGFTSLFPMRDLSVMGIIEVLPKLPTIIGRLNQTCRDIIRRQPEVVVTIDSPDFTLRVIKRVRKRCPNTKFIHYVAPTVWAWRPERAEKMARLVDGLMCLFPFEPGYFTPFGLNAVCTGHPAVDLKDSVAGDVSAFCDKYDLIQAKLPTAVSLLFGSREGELKRLGPTLFETANILLTEWPSLRLYVPAVPHLVADIKALIGRDQRFVLIDPADRYTAFALSGAALAASGTVGLELALMDVPHVVAYKLSKFSYRMARKMVQVEHMHLINILLGKRVVPEFLQDECQPDVMAASVLDALSNRDGAATRQRVAFAQARHLLRGEGQGTPADQAAAFVLGHLSA